MIKKIQIRQEIIIGAKRMSNFFLVFFLFFGGFIFFLFGVSSYLQKNLFPFLTFKELIFIPQGLIMTFYGTISIGISLYILFTIFLDLGSGYNEYNKVENLVKIVRKGFPGKNRKIFLSYPLQNIRAIGIRITEGINSQQEVYLCLKDKRNIPLALNQQPISIIALEKQASQLAKFLNLKLENL